MNSMIEDDQKQINLKLIFLGDQGVGKSSILNRFAQDKFEEGYQATIGLDYHSKFISVENQDIKVILFDTAGQEKFKSLLKLYIRDANIVVAVYDITSKASFDKIEGWIDETKDTRKDDNTIIALVGNKLDITTERQVSTAEASSYAKTKNYLFEEVSAKTGAGISSLFYDKIFEQVAVQLNLRPSTIKDKEVIDSMLKIGTSEGRENLNHKKESCCK